MIGYLNINSLRNKIDQIRDLVSKAPIDILCVDETKLDSSFPDQQFKIEGYHFPPFRKDKNISSGGKIVFIRENLIVKRLKDFESSLIESICMELTVSNKKWFLLFAYRPPRYDRKLFFDEIIKCLSKGINKYDNISLIGDLNIDLLDPSKDIGNYLSDLSDTFNLTNIVKGTTCFKSSKGTLLDILLTNKPNSFQKTATFITGISDFHKLVTSFLRVSFKKLPPKEICYRKYKKFDDSKFRNDLDRQLLQGEIYKDCKDPYSKFTEILSQFLEKHAPLKRRKIRGNHKPFMTKGLSKAIMNRSKLKNIYNKWPSRENFLAFKKSRNYCNSLNRKTKRQYFKEASSDGIMNNKKFWDTIQ